VVQLFFASLALCIGERNISEPGLATVKFLISIPRVDNLPDDVEVRTTKLAEFQLVALI